MANEDHRQWITVVSGGTSVRGVAQAAGLTHRTLAYQLEKGSVSMENVVAIALAYGRHPVGALVETGYLEAKWATQVSPLHALRTIPTDDLLGEVRRRIPRGPSDSK